jgi:hypothetical protein
MKMTGWHAWARRWWAEVALDARLAPFACVDCRVARRSPGGQDVQNWARDCCSLLCWQASEARLVLLRMEGPNGGSISKERWWVARNEFGFVAADGRWTGCVEVVAECTSHSL